MKTSTRLLSIAAAVLTLGAGSLAFAHNGQGEQGRMGGMGMQHGTAQGMHKGMGMHGGNSGEMGGGMGRGMGGAGQAGDAAARLAATKTELKITAEQESAWQAFESVVKKQADARQAMRTNMQARMKDPAAAASVDHAAMRETMRKHRETELAERDKARQALYAVLSPEQKAVADQRLHSGHGQRQRGHRHAG